MLLKDCGTGRELRGQMLELNGGNVQEGPAVENENGVDLPGLRLEMTSGGGSKRGRASAPED